MKKLFNIASITLPLLVSLVVLTSCSYKSEPSNDKKTFYQNKEVTEPILSDNPVAKDIIQRLKAKNKNNSHPRLMASAQDFDRIKTLIGSDKQLNERYLYMRVKANSILNETPVVYELPDGVRLLNISRKVLDRIQILSFVYRISGEKKYAERAWLELQTISGKNTDQERFAFADWHPAHFLDTAEMTNAAAIGYDWLYDYLSPEQRTVIREAIYEKGLKPALNAYKKNDFWVKADHNWNGVCNGGIGMGALAIGDEGGDFETLSGEILENAVKFIPMMLKQYSPDGGWFEGPGYWDYGTTYAAYFLSALSSSLGTDYELSNVSGFSLAGDFPIFMAGPKGTFNFADAGSGIVKSPALLYLAGKFNKPEYLWYFNKVSLPKDGNVMTFIWHNQKLKETEPKIQDKYFRNVEAAAMHSNFMNPQEMFVGFKAGTNGLNHGDLDIGSFVLDADGVRWFTDIGSENYNLPGYFEMGQNGRRWQYYRKRAESHNTLVINPSSKPDQNPVAKTKIETFKESPKSAFAIADITDAYKGEASSVKRGIKMDKENRIVTVQDEITALKPSEIWWFANTAALIELSSDKKTATLTKDGKKLNLMLSSPSSASFEITKAEPLSTSPNPKGQSDNYFQKLTVHLSNAGSATICVVISPGSASDGEVSKKQEIVPLGEWR